MSKINGDIPNGTSGEATPEAESGGSTDGGSAGNGEAAHDAPGGDLGGDIVAFLYEDLARGTDDKAGAGAVEELRRRSIVGARLTRKVGFDRARPYLLTLREYRRAVCRLFEVPEAPLD